MKSGRPLHVLSRTANCKRDTVQLARLDDDAATRANAIAAIGGAPWQGREGISGVAHRIGSVRIAGSSGAIAGAGHIQAIGRAGIGTGCGVWSVADVFRRPRLSRAAEEYLRPASDPLYTRKPRRAEGSGDRRGRYPTPYPVWGGNGRKAVLRLIRAWSHHI